MNYYSDIHFKKVEELFQHNLNDDFACFALWKSARPFHDKIRELLHNSFSIVLETEIEWSEEYFKNNALRLYESPIYIDAVAEENKSGHYKKIGDNRFIIIIVKDKHPKYTYAKSVSGKIEMSNLNIVNAKFQMRSWIQAESGEKYAVHSTNNIFEFFFQVPLLLGTNRFNRILNGEKLDESNIKKDLEGAGGWESYTQMFDILNHTSNYLIQRGFESLPNSNPEMDIDFLTDHFQRLASALGLRQRRNKPYKGNLKVGNDEISIDIRYVGDKYYNTAWAKDMLDRKKYREGLFIPREDDYFFSLLYHAKVQKPNVKNKYVPILNQIASSLEFDWYKTSMLSNDEEIGKLIKGYFSAHSYVYEKPIDSGVYNNKKVSLFLPTLNHSMQKKVKYGRLKKIARKILPERVIKMIKKKLKK